jgi:hypothetical protein
MGYDALPENLAEAIDVMAKSELVAEVLGEHVFDFFLRNKRRSGSSTGARSPRTSGSAISARCIFTAIFTSYDSFGEGLASTVIFGLVGIAIMGLAFLVLDWMTPGKLGEVICTPERHPARWSAPPPTSAPP